MEKRLEGKNKGITLIALVITIIVLLILAGISIAMLTGENGILTKADGAKRETRRQEIIESAKLEILEYQAENEGKITKDKEYEIIAKYDKDYNPENSEIQFKIDEGNGEEYFTTEEGYDILVSEIWKIKKIKFSINVGEFKDAKYGGEFEVEEGTTWEQFFKKNFADDAYGWLYNSDTKEIGLYSDDYSASVHVSLLKNEIRTKY